MKDARLGGLGAAVAGQNGGRFVEVRIDKVVARDHVEYDGIEPTYRVYVEGIAEPINVTREIYDAAGNWLHSWFIDGPTGVVHYRGEGG